MLTPINFLPPDTVAVDSSTAASTGTSTVDVITVAAESMPASVAGNDAPTVTAALAATSTVGASVGDAVLTGDNGAVTTTIDLLALVPESGDTPTTTNAAATSSEEMATALQAAGVPISLSNPNHASLPNILSSMASHGPPVDQWEGNELLHGEGSVQDISFLIGLSQFLCVSNVWSASHFPSASNSLSSS